MTYDQIIVAILGVLVGFFAVSWWYVRRAIRVMRRVIKLHQESIKLLQRTCDNHQREADIWREIAIAHKRQAYRLLYGGKADLDDTKSN